MRSKASAVMTWHNVGSSATIMVERVPPSTSASSPNAEPAAMVLSRRCPEPDPTRALTRPAATR